MRALLLLIFVLLAGSVPARAADEPLAVIVGAEAPPRTLEAAELALIFKRKKLFWDNGVRIEAVNLPAAHPLRRRFSQSVLKSPPEAQTQYWNSLYYHGVFPPHVVASGEAMLRFVGDTRGAIGYVAACQLDARVRALLWIDEGGAISATPPAYSCPP